MVSFASHWPHGLFYCSVHCQCNPSLTFEKPKSHSFTMGRGLESCSSRFSSFMSLLQMSCGETDTARQPLVGHAAWGLLPVASKFQVLLGGAVTEHTADWVQVGLQSQTDEITDVLYCCCCCCCCCLTPKNGQW